MATRTPTTGLSTRAIMQAAWRLYRLHYGSSAAKIPFYAAGFAWALKTAWAQAKDAVRVAALTVAQKAERVAQIRNEIHALAALAEAVKPKAVPIPMPRPEPAGPIIVAEPPLPAIGHNGGPPLADKPLSPIEQMNKPVKGAQAATGAGAIGGAVILLVQSAGWLPTAWESGAPAVALGLVVGWASTTVGGFLGGYFARDKRFTTAA